MEMNSPISQEIPTSVSVDTVSKGLRKRRIIIFAVVSILNLSLLGLLGYLLFTPHSGSSTSNDVTGQLGDSSSTLLGHAAPDFTLSTLNSTSKQVHLAALKGKPVVINFWASDCIPCNDEASFLQQTWSQQLQPKGVVFIGLDSPESTVAAQGFIQKYHITYTNVKDAIDGSTALNYGTTGNPETFFIDANGVVQAHWLGIITSAGMQEELAKIHA
jgi:cytochrome c biogenesis protein CcmG, thiol:disulfide interchange protein DsbE